MKDKGYYAMISYLKQDEEEEKMTIRLSTPTFSIKVEQYKKCILNTFSKSYFAF